MSAQEKIAALDNMFMELETLKTQAGTEAKALNDIIKQLIEVYKSNSSEGLTEVFGSVKSFLDSGNNTMMSINNDLRVINSDLARIQQIFGQMGV